MAEFDPSANIGTIPVQERHRFDVERLELFMVKNKSLNLDVKKIEELIADRNNARKSKNWSEADRCRDELTAIGVLITDTPHGTEWEIK